jgi:hypothetical protein
LDGALVVRMRFQLNAGEGVEDDGARPAALDLDQRLVPDRFHVSHVHRFAITNPVGALTLRHIAIVLEPLYRIGTSILDVFSPPHVEVEVVGANSGVPCSLLLPEPERPSMLQVPRPDVGLSLVRHALGLPTYVETEAGRQLLNGWLTPAEMQATQLIAMVNQMLQEPEAVRTVVVAT